jgi:amidase
VASLTDISASRLALLIREREVSAVEVVDAYLARIEALNPRLNAIVSLAPDARERAAETDRRQASGAQVGPLHGVPFTVKDIIDADGMPTTLGLPARANSIAQRDATVAARMRAAGAILLGKTNCPPGGAGGDTVNDLFGRTLNPYHEGHLAGGSSGGEAAAVAAGLTACGIGSDSGGSLRLPAHYCGVATLKPTAGRVPLTGVHEESSPIGALADPRTQVGPLARSVDDLALLLSVLAGPDGHDAGLAPIPLADPAAVGLRNLRLATQTTDGEAPPDAPTAAIIEDARRSLERAGMRVVERSLPGGGHELTRRIWQSYDGELSSLDLYEVLREWDAYRTQMLEWLAEVDVVLAPVAPSPAPTIGGDVDFRYTTPFSLTGWPCAVVRAGESDGLPIGVQLIAGPWLDHVALAAAAQIEADLGGYSNPLAV